MIINLPTMRIKATLRANNLECFTYKMAEKNSWHRQERKRHCHPLYTRPQTVTRPKTGGQIFGHRVNGRCLRASDVAATTHIAQIVRRFVCRRYQACPWVELTHGLGWVHYCKSAKNLKGLCQCI